MTGAARHRRLQGINDRIRYAAQDRGIDPNRLRRSLVFQRMLVRLSPCGLVLKGGYALEARLGGIARTTKDVDLIGRLALLDDPDAVADAVDEALGGDPDTDGFTFRCGDAKRLRDPSTSHHAWRIPVEAFLDGHRFEVVKLDLVGQVDEVDGAVESLVIPAPVAGLGLSPVRVAAVDVFQHAAEKFHACSRVYAQDQPSSRTKDLVDLVLLVEADLLTDPDRLNSRMAVVWAERDGTPPPATLPVPPGSWVSDYAHFAADLNLTTPTLDAAYRLVAGLYASAQTPEGNPT